METPRGSGADSDARGRVIGMTRAGLAAPWQAFAVGMRVSFVLKPSVWGWVARDVRPVRPPAAAAPGAS